MRRYVSRIFCGLLFSSLFVFTVVASALAAAPDNILVNEGFEEDLTGWKVSGGGAEISTDATALVAFSELERFGDLWW